MNGERGLLLSYFSVKRIFHFLKSRATAPLFPWNGCLTSKIEKYKSILFAL